MTKREVQALFKNPLLTQKQAAAYLGVCLETFENYRRTGLIACAKLGHRTIRVRRAELDRFIDDRILKDRNVSAGNSKRESEWRATAKADVARL